MKYLTGNYDIDKNVFISDFKDCSDFILREIELNSKKAFFCIMDGLVDSLTLSKMVTTPILNSELNAESSYEYIEAIKKHIASSLEINELQTFDNAFFLLSSGFAILVVDGSKRALAFGVQGWNKRSTDEPSNEAMVKGAKECFVETLNDNKALLRKRLKTPSLKLKQLTIGKECKTSIVIAYITGKAEQSTVDRIEKRINDINADAMVDFGLIVESLESNIKSPFSSAGNTERPDVLASKLLEGRIGVLTDGTPFAVYFPYLFTDNFSSLDDYDNPVIYSSFIRLLKYFSFVISVFLPAIYVAIGSYHQEMIPTNLLYIIAASEESTPFPLMLEGVIIHLLYEIMREAGLRLPKTVGHAVSIIGAIVIGEAMVNAGIIGEPMLVVVALTAIASYAVYSLYESVAVLRIALIIIAGFSGLYGVMLSGAVLFVNICALNPYGVPYSAPISPLTKASLSDTVIRANWKSLLRKRKNIFDLTGADNER